jgi:sugar lactone lactonase YvrE
MRVLLSAVAWAWLAAAPSPTRVPAPKDAFDYARQGREAYQRGDMAAFLQNYEAAARLRPGDVWILYNLACGEARNGQTEAAIRTLRDIAAHRVFVDLPSDTDLDSIRNQAGYKEVVARMETLRQQRIDSGATVAFTVHQRGLVPEGVAFDPVTRSFFLSSIRQRKILRVGSDGHVSDFVSPARDGLRGAAGMGVDAKRRTLWVASQAMPHMNDFRKGDPPASAVFEYDVDSGRLRKEHRPPAADPPPAFDDLTVASDGRVYVNDGQSPRIFTLAPEKGKLELFLESDVLRGTQGLAVTPDGKTLYASDYNGLVRIDVASRKITPIPVPPDLALNGIDGLVHADGSLVGIQNGIRPHRVIRLDLGPDGITISRARILEMNHPAFDEPTLGVVAGGRLYFTADSQGGRFLDEKHPISPEDMRDAVVLMLPLRPDPR